jgi:glutamyl-tRNA(Gln) amidotransferase subunit E
MRCGDTFDMNREPDPNQAGTLPPSDLNPRREAALELPDADYGELSVQDYHELGFMAGLEVHQQLDTRSKLFCRCPAGRRGSVYDAEVLRHMRPTLSELGEYDGTALMEFKTRKEIVYQLSRSTVCTYEIDDTPPFEIDEEAVGIALELSMQFNLNLISELHVMRKQYLDGSIPTGFQRTAMVGLTGTIPFRVPELGVDRELRIRQLSLEEDSCREISDIGHRVTFHTDRLGMPLTEAVTEPDLLTPLELQAAGLLLAQVARSTGKVRRGPGAARQDVNVSVAGGRRVEIKGVDNHRGLPQLVHIEAFRQLNLLRIKHELDRRGLTGSMFVLPDKGLPWEVSPLAVEAEAILRDCEFAPIRDALSRGETVCAVRLPGFAELLSRRTQPGVTFAREFADRVRVIACPEHRPFLIHSDIRDYGLDSRQWRALQKQLDADSGDAIVVVWGLEQDAATAAREILIRARDALVGVPSETRQAFSDGTNGFERILPGADRMYPDTDTPPLPIADSLVDRIRASAKETPWKREQRYGMQGLSFGAARQLAAAPWADLYDALDPRDSDTAQRLAGSLARRLPYHLRRRSIEVLPESARLETLVRAIEAGEIRPEAMDRVLDELITRGDTPANDLMDRYRRRAGDEADLNLVLEEVVQHAAELPGRSIETLVRWGMGTLMRRFLGRLDPNQVKERLELELSAVAPETTK